MNSPTTSPDAAARPAARSALLAQAVTAGVAGTVLALLSLAGPGALVVGVAALQVLLVLCLLVVLDAPGRLGACVVALAATVAADAVVLFDDGEVDGLAGVVALSLVAALLHQLLRRGGRSRVTASLADTLLAVVLVVAAACLVALRAEHGARTVAVTALAAGAACLLVARLGDRLTSRPPLGRSPTRGVPGLLLGLAAGAVAGLVAAALGAPPVGPSVLLGLAAAAAVAAGDLAACGAELGPGRGRARRVAALRPVAALLPYAVLGPVALVGGRLVLG